MKLFVWDLHGVLERGNELAVGEITNAVLQNFGYSERLTPEDCRKLYGEKWYKYFEYLLPSETAETHQNLSDTCFIYSDTHPELLEQFIMPNDFVYEVLDAIKKSHDQILISNTKPDSLKLFLDHLELYPYFETTKAFAVSTHDRNAKVTKNDTLESYLLGKSFEEIIVIGDSPGDMAMKGDGRVTYLYSHPGIKFRECESDHRIQDLREVLTHV